MHRITHFEIHAQDPQRAMKFYTSLFGWDFKSWGDESYWLITTGPEGTPGINGGLAKRMGPAPAESQGINGFVNVIDVESVDSHMAKIVKAGGSAAVPKVAIPRMGYTAYFKDTEGNLFGIFQSDKTAK